MSPTTPFVAAGLVLHAATIPAVLAQVPPQQEEDLVVFAPPPIVLDAQFDDWSAISPQLVDPADAAADSFVDFGEVRVSHDERFVHLLIDFGRTVNAQGLDGTAMILLDADGDPKTGAAQFGLAGTDIIIDLSPPHAPSPGSRRTEIETYGIGLRSTTYTPPPPPPTPGGGQPVSKVVGLNPYDIGFAFAPTHAGRRIEFRIQRGTTIPNTPPVLAGARFSGKIVHVDVAGNIADQTDTFSNNLTPIAAQEIMQESDPLARPEDARLRAMNWNVLLGAIFTKPEPFVRSLRAIKPDLILFQELADENSAAQLQAFLNSAMPVPDRGSWHVVFGAGGGDLRCAVASTHPLEESPTMALIAMPDRPDRSLRACSALVRHEGKTLLAVSVHLKCCGRADGPEDQQRLVEVQLLQQAIRAVMAQGSPKIDGLIIAGDFNLVGSRDPLEHMMAGLDLDRSALGVAEPMQIDGLSNATWSDPLQPFVPGRLDYMLFSDASLSIRNSLVFDSRDLSAQWLKEHDLRTDDTTAASDHFPVVVDLEWSDD